MATELDDATLAELDRRHRGGESWARLAVGLGVHKDRVRGKVRRWRERAGTEEPPTEQLTETPLLQAAKSGAPLDRVLDSLLAYQDAQGELREDAPVLRKRLPGDKPVCVVVTGDWHVGGSGVDHRRLLDDLRLWQETDGLYVCHIGDWADNFLPRILPSAALGQIVRPRLQWELVEHLIAKHLGGSKLLCGLVGNHDAWSEIADLHPLEDLLKRQGVPFLGHGGRVWLEIGTQRYKLELRHQFNFKSSLNVTNSHRNLFQAATGADVVAMGHLHSPIMHYEQRGEWGTWWVQCSSYKAQDDYAQAKGLNLGYDPPPPYMPAVVLWPDRHHAMGFVDYRDALAVLEVLRR